MMKTIIISLLLFFTVQAQTVWYVDFDRATGGGTYDGTTYATAWNFFDNTDGYDSRATGVNWSSLSAGDTILISGTYRPNNGFGVAIYNEHISGGYVYIKPNWTTNNALFENSDTLVTIAPYTSSAPEANVFIQNCTGLYFMDLEFRVNEPRPSYVGTRSINLNLEGDSLITFYNCHFITNGVAGCIGMDTPAKISFINCLIESEYNTYTEDNDLFTWSQAGYGEHLIEGNTIINRNAYIGESGTASASDSSGTGFTVTVSGANWATDLHKNANITMNGATMTIWSNDATHLYGYEWNDGDDPPTILPKPNAGSYTIASTAHRDVMQMGYGNNPSRPTTKFINNFIWVLYEQDVNSWNQLHYLGDDASHISIQDFVYIGNTFVCPIDTNGNGVGVIAQNWPNASSLSKWEFYNNTFIATGGWFGNTQVMDSCVAYNNVFVVLNPNSVITLGRSDLVSVDSIDYNYWSVPNWNTRTWLNDATFLWDNYVYYNWSTWQAAGNDVNSFRDVNGTFEFQDIIDSTLTAYIPPTSLRDVGKNLSYLLTKYPELQYDALGNERGYNGTWDIGSLEYTGIESVDSLPDAFTLTDISNAELNTTYYAQTGDIVGFDSAYAHVSAGEYNIDGGSYVGSTVWTKVFPTNDAYLRYTTGSSYDSTVNITLTVGSRSDIWTITTKSAPSSSSEYVLTKDATGVPIRMADGKLMRTRTSSYTSPAEPDTIAPNPPTSFVAIGGTSQTQFQTNWTNPTASDLDSIRYYEGSSNDTTTMAWIVSLPATTGYLRTGRTANTTYWGAVKAVDDSGNVSYFSPTDSATTLSSGGGGTPLANLDLAYLTQSFGAHLYDHSAVGSAGTTTMQDEMTDYNTLNSTSGSLTRITPDYPAAGDMIWHWNQVFYGGSAFSNTQNVITEYANTSTYDILQVVIGFNSAAINYAGWYNDASDTATYPQGHIENSYKYWIRNMVSAMELHPDKYWILWDIPAEVESAGNSSTDVGRQASFNTWMVDTLQAGLDSYGAFPSNVYIFDIFSLLKNAGNNWMNDAYSDGTGDSHPNATAQDFIAPIYIQRVFDNARAYRIP
jgi:hypothetical protein